MLYKGLKGKARIPTDDIIPKNRRCRNQHSLRCQMPSASLEAYESSFFLHTIRDRNDLPDSLISSAEMSDDGVSNFEVPCLHFVEVTLLLAEACDIGPSNVSL